MGDLTPHHPTQAAVIREGPAAFFVSGSLLFLLPDATPAGNAARRSNVSINGGIIQRFDGLQVTLPSSEVMLRSSSNGMGDGARNTAL